MTPAPVWSHCLCSSSCLTLSVSVSLFSLTVQSLSHSHSYNVIDTGCPVRCSRWSHYGCCAVPVRELVSLQKVTHCPWTWETVLEQEFRTQTGRWCQPGRVSAVLHPNTLGLACLHQAAVVGIFFGTVFLWSLYEREWVSPRRGLDYTHGEEPGNVFFNIISPYGHVCTCECYRIF